MPKPIIRKISDQAVTEATGWSWEEWFKFLDEEGAKELEHKETVRLLRDKGGLSKNWWCQMVTLEYEIARGLRQVGETEKTGFEIGIRRTYETSPRHAWSMLTKPQGMALWLGADPPIELKKGNMYQTPRGETGEIRTIQPGSSVRLTWRPVGGSHVSTIQIRVIPSGRNAVVAIHHEGLASEKEREIMRRHWNIVLARLQDLWS